MKLNPEHFPLNAFFIQYEEEKNPLQTLCQALGVAYERKVA